MAAASSVDTEVVTVSGNGTYTTPIGYTCCRPQETVVPGVYQWNASYSSGAATNSRGQRSERLR